MLCNRQIDYLVRKRVVNITTNIFLIQIKLNFLTYLFYVKVYKTADLQDLT